MLIPRAARFHNAYLDRRPTTADRKNISRESDRRPRRGGIRLSALLPETAVDGRSLSFIAVRDSFGSCRGSTAESGWM